MYWLNQIIYIYILIDLYFQIQIHKSWTNIIINNKQLNKLQKKIIIIIIYNKKD